MFYACKLGFFHCILEDWNQKIDTVYREIFACVLFLAPSPSLLAGKFKTGLLPNLVLANNISYNTIVSGWIQDGKKPFASVDGWK